MLAQCWLNDWRWLRWHCPPNTGFEIRSLTVWGRARYLSVTDAPHNTELHTWLRKKHFCFFQTAGTGNRTPNSSVKGSGANHYPRAPAPQRWEKRSIRPITQSTVQPVPTRHRRYACIIKRTALPANMKTWPDVVSMLVQRRWRWANSETALGQILAFAGPHTGVCLHPPLPSIIFSPADQGTFSKTAGQSQAYYNTWNWERGTYDVNHLHILTCEVAVSRVSSV